MDRFTNEYAAIIKQIRKKQKKVVTLGVIAVLVALAIGSPLHITTADNVIVDSQGATALSTILNIIFILIWEFLAYLAAMAPINASMDVECDPKKNLALTSALNRSKYYDTVCTTDFTFMGDFETALRYSNRLITNKKPLMRLNGLFCKARCEFFLQDFEALKNTVAEHDQLLSTIKAKPALVAAVNKRGQTLHLLLALVEGDKEKIANARNIEVWVNSRAMQGYLDYLKGVAAYVLEEKEEAVYRLMSVKEHCSKTVFATLAEEYLSKLKQQS